MKTLWIHCPKCRKASKLFLTGKPYLMVLNCPVCHCTLINSEGKTVEINDVKILKMNRGKMRGFVERIKRQQAQEQKAMTQYMPDASVSQANNRSEIHALHKMGEPIKDQSVSRDDIYNIKIALETSRDVSDFLKSI